jgi:uncharacterized spore protein YtfJ
MSTEIVPNEEPMAALDLIQNAIDEFLATADVHAVYGEPIEHGDTLIIPTAEVLCAMGFGVGSGTGSSSVDEDGNAATRPAPGYGSGGGGGGGGRVFSRPVAVVISDSKGVRIEPVIDLTKVALASLTAVGFMAGILLRMLSPKKALPKLDE